MIKRAIRWIWYWILDPTPLTDKKEWNKMVEKGKTGVQAYQGDVLVKANEFSEKQQKGYKNFKTKIARLFKKS